MKIVEYKLTNREWWLPFEAYFYSNITNLRPVSQKYGCNYPDGFLGKNLFETK